MPAKFLSSAKRAFTIVELLVAVAVTAVLVTLMVTITINVLSAWNRSSGNLTAGNQARLVLDQLSQDLQGAIIRRDMNVWLVASVQGDQTGAGDSGIGEWAGGKPNEVLIAPTTATAIENPEFPLSIENYRFGQAGVWLRFFSTPSDNSGTSVENASAPRAISYQMVRRRIGSGSPPERVYTLYRSEAIPAAPSGSNSTFAVGYDLLMAATAPSYNYNGSDDIVFDGGDRVGPGVGTIRRPLADYIIANDVIDFGIKLYAGRDASGNDLEVFPVDRRGGGSTPATVFVVTADTTKTDSFSGGTHAYGYPTAADVMVRILTPEGVRLIQAFERGEPVGETWWDIAIQHSQVYTRRIDIKSKGL